VQTAGGRAARHFLLPGRLVIALWTLVDFVLEAAIRRAAWRLSGDEVPPAVDHDPVTDVVGAGFDLPQVMPAPPRALSHPAIPCAASIPMGPRKDLPIDPISSGGPRLHGGPSKRNALGVTLPPIHRAKAAVQHAQYSVGAAANPVDRRRRRPRLVRATGQDPPDAAGAHLRAAAHDLSTAAADGKIAANPVVIRGAGSVKRAMHHLMVTSPTKRSHRPTNGATRDKHLPNHGRLRDCRGVDPGAVGKLTGVARVGNGLRRKGVSADNAT
jgi:hypothetical protein